ncbi:glutathione peroxidase [Pseudomonas putida S16]|nr:glutathione peroxidase [Pseudomonas putida S16]
MPVLALLASASSWAADCPALLQGSLPELRGKGQVDLCERFAGKPLVVVNTASYCGFAPQFEGLEATYKEYHGQGLEMLGVPSNDFKQEDADSEKTAKVCYANYGVTFTMTKTQSVRGGGCDTAVRGAGKPEQCAEVEFLQVRGGPQGQGD